MPRRLGQHFLIRQSVIERILRVLDPQPSDSVLEIGPGRGALTAFLVPQIASLLLVEKDPAMVEHLMQKMAERPQVKMLTGDFLQIPWATLREEIPGKFKILSNLPYESGTAIFLKCLNEAEAGTELVLMFQKEVAERLLGLPRTKDYGSLSVWTQVLAEVRRCFDVPPAAFQPPPKVESTVVSIRIRETPLVPREKLRSFEKLLKAGFGQRRKMLRQNLKTYFTKNSSEEIETRLVAIGANPQARAEELTVEQWVCLFS